MTINKATQWIVVAAAAILLAGLVIGLPVIISGHAWGFKILFVGMFGGLTFCSAAVLISVIQLTRGKADEP